MRILNIRAALGSHPWAERTEVLESVDSTSSYVARLTAQGAPDGTVVLAERQTGGRGRQGRSFASPAGQGVYCSVLLRPALSAGQLGLVTVMAAVAACDAIETACGVRPGIKWTNDLILGGKKLCGILTELSVRTDGTAEHLILGVGINVHQKPEDFPAELQPVATSIFAQTGRQIDCDLLAAELICALYTLSKALPGDRGWLDRYRADCVTVGRQVKILRGSEVRYARADAIDDAGALCVTYDDGTTGTIASGEVSVRGLLGYV